MVCIHSQPCIPCVRVFWHLSVIKKKLTFNSVKNTHFYDQKSKNFGGEGQGAVSLPQRDQCHIRQIQHTCLDSTSYDAQPASCFLNNSSTAGIVTYFAPSTCCCMSGLGRPSSCSSRSTRLDLYATLMSIVSTSLMTSITGPGPTDWGNNISRPLLRYGPVKHR